MKSLHTMAIMLSVVLVSGMAAAPAAYGQALEPISIATDKESYAAGETITLTGEIRKRLQGAITIQIIAPNGNRAAIDQGTLGEDGMFTETFRAGGPNWFSTGTYTINVTYGPGTNLLKASTTIEYGGGEAPTTPVQTGPSIDPDLTGIRTTITGGSIVSITPSSTGIEIRIDATDDGVLTLEIPRDILESKTDGQMGGDIPFIILIDGGEFDATETVGPTSRTIEIPFTAGSELIEVIGSWIIPEFGVIAVAILAVAIVAIIVASAKTNIGIIPRY